MSSAEFFQRRNFLELTEELRRIRTAAQDPSGSRDLADSAVGLVDRFVGVGARTRVAVGNCNAPQGPAGHFARRLAAIEHKLVPQAAVFVGIAVRPAVERDRRDITCGIKTTRTKNLC